MTDAHLLEVIRSWASPAILLAILTAVLRHHVLIRREKNAEAVTAIEATKAEALAAIESTKANNARDADIRDHYAAEVSQLRASLEAQSRRHRAAEIIRERNHRKAVAEAEKRAEECQRDRERLRADSARLTDELMERISALRDLVAGLRRVILQNSATAVLEMGDMTHPEVRAAAERVDALFADSAQRGTGHVAS